MPVDMKYLVLSNELRVLSDSDTSHIHMNVFSTFVKVWCLFFVFFCSDSAIEVMSLCLKFSVFWGTNYSLTYPAASLRLLVCCYLCKCSFQVHMLSHCTGLKIVKILLIHSSYFQIFGHGGQWFGCSFGGLVDVCLQAFSVCLGFLVYWLGTVHCDCCFLVKLRAPHQMCCKLGVVWQVEQTMRRNAWRKTALWEPF